MQQKKHKASRKPIKLNIKNQLYMVYLFAILIPIMILGFYLISNTRDLISKHHYAQINSDNLRVRSIILDTTTSIKNLADEFFEDEDLQNILSQSYVSPRDSNDSLRTYKVIDTILSKYTEVSSIRIYTMNKTISNYGYFVTVTPEIADEEWFIKASNTAAYLWRTQTVKNSKGITSNELSLSYRIPVLKRGDFAIVVINISDNYLKSRINNNTLKTQIAVNDDPIFYGSNRKLDKKIDLTIDHENKYFTYSGDCLYGNKEALVELSTFIPLQSYDRIYISTIDYDAINDTRRITLICTTILLFSIIVPLIVVIWYTSRFSSRLDTLRGEMHKVSGGDYNIIDIFKGNDELSEVFTDLKIMIASIKELDKQIYQDKISQQKLVNHQQKMEFDMLASQINPHFLYNTLETIRMKAFANHDRDVANAVKQLGKYMRHNLESSGTTTTLKVELEYIEIYLSIQKLRFNDRVNYSITVDPTLDVGSYKILPLLIQPIVENAILHGLEDVEENGRIHINVRPENELLIISVTDNGIGMYSDKLTELLLKIHSQKKNIKTSIGLYNIHQRILLCYGKEYGLDITSKPGEGTTVSLILPLHHDWEEA